MENFYHLEEHRKVFNVDDWYQRTTLDILGSLLFGEALGCLDKGMVRSS